MKAYNFECPEHKATFLSTKQTAVNCKQKAAVFSFLVVASSGGARRLPRGDGGNITQDAGGALEVKHGVGDLGSIYMLLTQQFWSSYF